MSALHKPGWKLEAFARRAGVPSRTVRYYVQRGLLPAPVFRGRDTVYSEEHLIRLQAIRRLQEEFLPLDVIQKELEGRSVEELQRLAGGLGDVASRQTSAGGSARAGLSHRPPAAPQPVLKDGDPWLRVVLAPGLELHLAEQAEAETRQWAEEICREFAGHRVRGKTRT